MAAFGASLLAASGKERSDTLQRYLPMLFSDDAGEQAGKAIPYESQVWLDQIEVMCAFSVGSISEVNLSRSRLRPALGASEC